MFDELNSALNNAHPRDISEIKKYVAWVKFRRYINNIFYLLPDAHWVGPQIRYHWVKACN